ncbi:MAG: Dehydroquinase class, partial [Clostridiales bacterium]|nr:Dehydroquinase class [Clostridiales bacterium]
MNIIIKGENMMSKEKESVLVIHGPNLNLLGIREKNIYGSETYESINNRIIEEAKQLGIHV